MVRLVLRPSLLILQRDGLSYIYSALQLLRAVYSDKPTLILCQSYPSLQVDPIKTALIMTDVSPPLNLTSATNDVFYREEILFLVGPTLIGALVNWVLLGVLTMQIYAYYLCFPRDYGWIKFSAYGLYLLEIGQTVLITDIAWANLCAGWGSPAALMQNNWGFSMNPLASGLIACWGQTFFAWRVWALGRTMFWKSVAAVILVLSFAQGGAAAGLSFNFFRSENITNTATALTDDLFFFHLGASALADFLIAVSMLHFLFTTRKMNAWSKQTDRRITKLIRITFETGGLSSAMALFDLAFFKRAMFLHIFIVMVLSKLYSNALMASLNSRAGVYERPTMSNGREENRTTGFNTVQFTSVGIPVTIGGFEREGKSDEEGAKLEYVKTKRGHPGVVFNLTDPGSV